MEGVISEADKKALEELDVETGNIEETNNIKGTTNIEGTIETKYEETKKEVKLPKGTYYNNGKYYMMYEKGVVKGSTRDLTLSGKNESRRINMSKLLSGEIKPYFGEEALNQFNVVRSVVKMNGSSCPLSLFRNNDKCSCVFYKIPLEGEENYIYAVMCEFDETVFERLINDTTQCEFVEEVNENYKTITFEKYINKVSAWSCAYEQNIE